MKIHTKVLFIFLLNTSFINSTTAHEHRLVGVMLLANTCLAQDEERTRENFRKLFFETEINAQPEELKGLPGDELERRYKKAIWGLIESPWAVCVRKKQWLSKELCNDFIPIVLTQSVDNVPKIIEKHRAEIATKKEVFNWADKAFGSDNPKFSCPE